VSDRKQLSLRSSDELEARLDALVAKYPMLTRHKLALIALERGLAAIEGDPRWFEKVGKVDAAEKSAARAIKKTTS